MTSERIDLPGGWWIDTESAGEWGVVWLLFGPDRGVVADFHSEDDARAFAATLQQQQPQAPAGEALSVEQQVAARGTIDRWLAIESTAERLVLAVRNAMGGRTSFLNRLSEVADEMDADLARIEPPTNWIRAAAPTPDQGREG